MKQPLLALLVIGWLGCARAGEPLVFSSVEDSVIDEVGFLVLQEAYSRLNQEITRQTYPAERALVLASGGQNDGVVVRMPGIEREYPDLLMVPVMVTHEDGVVYTKNVSLKVQGWGSLRPYRLGIRRGIKFIEKGTAGMQVLSATDNEQLFEMLDRGRVQLVVLPRWIGTQSLRRVRRSEIRALEPAAGSVELYHYLHKRHEARVPAITAALQSMARAGRIAAIRKEYLSTLSGR